MQKTDQALEILYAQLRDMMQRAERGIWSSTRFLTPREAHLARTFLVGAGYGEQMLAAGGYAEAERVKLFVLPDYMCEPEYTEPLLDQEISLLALRGGGFCTLTHRDYLGALLALGIERHVLGDLLVMDTSHALLFCQADIAPYLCAELSRVGRDGIKVEMLPLSTPFELPQRFVCVSDTVASARFDCVAAALCGLSREKAQMLIRAGECTVDYEPCDRCDKILEPPCVLSLRGYGKYRVDDLGTQTKKGRLRLYASKYI